MSRVQPRVHQPHLAGLRPAPAEAGRRIVPPRPRPARGGAGQESRRPEARPVRGSDPPRIRLLLPQPHARPALLLVLGPDRPHADQDDAEAGVDGRQIQHGQQQALRALRRRSALQGRSRRRRQASFLRRGGRCRPSGGTAVPGRTHVECHPPRRCLPDEDCADGPVCRGHPSGKILARRQVLPAAVLVDEADALRRLGCGAMRRQQLRRAGAVCRAQKRR
mmetsp:Transcript_23353/g.55150  ORF Transcript_23353/g.55150 Transcript_23353/m.55150 type:complete len:221 (+) Transcript_23353:523-1185(+)